MCLSRFPESRGKLDICAGRTVRDCLSRSHSPTFLFSLSDTRACSVAVTWADLSLPMVLASYICCLMSSMALACSAESTSFAVNVSFSFRLLMMVFVTDVTTTFCFFEETDNYQPHVVVHQVADVAILVSLFTSRWVFCPFSFCVYFLALYFSRHISRALRSLITYNDSCSYFVRRWLLFTMIFADFRGTALDCH